MAQLTMQVESGIFTSGDSILQSGQLGTDDIFFKLNTLLKFAAVRTELFNMGYFNDGAQPVAPVSLVDGAALSGDDAVGDELIYLPIYASNAPPGAGFILGSADFPPEGTYDVGRPLVVPYQNYFNPDNGTLVQSIYAFRTSNIDSQTYQYGISLMLCIAQRLDISYQKSTTLQKGTIITVAGSTSVNGSNFNGAFIINDVIDPQTFTYFQPNYDYPNGVNDAGGGGTITFGSPAYTANICPSPVGLKRYKNGKPGDGTVYCSLTTTPALS